MMPQMSKSTKFRERIIMESNGKKIYFSFRRNISIEVEVPKFRYLNSSGKQGTAQILRTLNLRDTMRGLESEAFHL